MFRVNEPEDIIWENLNVSLFSRICRFGFLVVIICFLTYGYYWGTLISQSKTLHIVHESYIKSNLLEFIESHEFVPILIGLIIYSVCKEITIRLASVMKYECYSDIDNYATEFVLFFSILSIILTKIFQVLSIAKGAPNYSITMTIILVYTIFPAA